MGLSRANGKKDETNNANEHVTYNMVKYLDWQEAGQLAI